MLQGGEILNELRGIQVALLAIVLIGACAAKLWRAITARSVGAALGPTALFPVQLRRAAAISVGVFELSLGVGLIVTASPLPGAPGLEGTLATYVRVTTALAFVTAGAALHELRGRRPEAGCGCFGDLSHTPVNWRTIARAALLAAAALASIGAQRPRVPGSPAAAWLLLAMIAAELSALAAVSPELGELMVRLGYSEPCEVRRIPVSRTLASLRASSQWRRYKRHLTDLEPSDVWREGCWRYAVFPGRTDGRLVDVVFAVYTKSRRPPIRAAVVDAVTGETAGGLLVPPPRTAADNRAAKPLPVFVPDSATALYRSIRETQ
ncbi:MAG: MauE/DoxX family redox-associated membrane protein [Trebonia sp.]